jgi:hypothetical protein
MEVSEAEVTVIVVVLLKLLIAALIVVVPATSAFAKPWLPAVLLMDAIVVAELLQVTEFVRG